MLNFILELLFFFSNAVHPVTLSIFKKKKSLVFVCFAVGELYQTHINFYDLTGKIAKNIPRNEHLREVFRVNLSCLRIWGLRRVHHLSKVRNNSTQPFMRFTYLKYSERRKKLNENKTIRLQNIKQQLWTRVNLTVDYGVRFHLIAVSQPKTICL